MYASSRSKARDWLCYAPRQTASQAPSHLLSFWPHVRHSWLYRCPASSRRMGDIPIFCALESYDGGTSLVMKETRVQALWGHGQPWYSYPWLRALTTCFLLQKLWLLWLPHYVLNGAYSVPWCPWLRRGLGGLLVASTSHVVPVNSLSSHWRELWVDSEV